MVSEKYFIHSSYPEVWTEKIRKVPIYQILRDFVEILEPCPNDIILEVGCGEGRFISLIAKKKATYIGSDISTRMLRYTKERLTNEKSKNIYLVAAEAKHLPFRSKSVNKCFSYATIFFIPQKENAIREMERVSKNKILVEFRNLLNPNITIALAVSRLVHFLLLFPLARKLVLTFMLHKRWGIEPYFPDSPLKIRRYFTKPFKTYTNIESQLKQCSVKTWFFKPTVIVEAILQS